MKAIVVLVTLLWSGAASAQGLPPTQGFPSSAFPPTAGEKQAVPAPAKPKAAKKKSAPAQPGMAAKLQGCFEHDDGTKARLDCYDAIIKPQPKPKPAKARAVTDCRFLKEEDERLACFNGFAEKLPRLPGAGARAPAAAAPPPAAEE
jgi:hypothetical protein